jgi:hypothetical protein
MESFIHEFIYADTPQQNGLSNRKFVVFLSHAPGFTIDNEVTNGMHEC